MPYISIIRPQDTSSLAHSAFADSVRSAGATVAATIEQRRKEKLAASKQEVADQQKNRQLDIEEMRAKAQLEREQGLGSARAEREQANAAARTAYAQEAGKAQAANETVAAQVALKDAMRSPQGALGPFGVLNPSAAVKVATAVGGVRQRAQAAGELAQQMTPEAGRAYMERFGKEEKAQALTQGYQSDLEALTDAVNDGIVPKERAQAYTAALQAAIKEGGAPGAIQQRVAIERQHFAQMAARAKAWEQAGKTAGDHFGDIEAAIGRTVDPEVRQNLMEKLADARGEWERTQAQSFQMKNDPDESLAGLEKVLYGAQAKAQPEQFLDRSIAQAQSMQRGGKPSILLQGQSGPAPGPKAVGSPPSRVAQNVRDGKQGRVGAPRGTSPKAPADSVTALVHEGAQKALSAGQDRRVAIADLIRRVAKELGKDPSDPAVMARVRQGLSDVYEGASR